MSDHAWTQDHIAPLVAGGLSAEERERAEAHARGCPECAAAVAAARDLDRGLADLFAGQHPAAALEDRVVQSLRLAEVRRPFFRGWRGKFTAGLAASVGLAAVGGTVAALDGPGGVPFPGSPGSLRLTDRSYSGAYAPAEGEVRITRESTSRLDEIARTPSKGSQALDDWSARHDRHDAAALAAEQAAKYRNAVLAAQAAIRDANELTITDRVRTELDTKAKTHAFTMDGVADGRLTQNGAVPTNATVWGDQAQAPLYGYTIRPPAPGVSPHLNLYYAPSAGKPALPTFGEQGQPKPGDNKAPDDPKNAPNNQKPKPAEDGPKPAPEPTVRRVVLRSGEIEFEVESFDSAVAAVTKLVAGIKGAFVATVNSDKLPNGKVKGSITVRVPPESLDGLVLDLRRDLGKGGELKGQRITSQDVTKQYTDLESRLRAARTMEERLLKIIKEGKGEIKDLIAAEKELGVWRTKIEEIEGELRYYSNLAALSTLTVTIAEKEIRAAAGLTESERVQAGVEVEDVEKAYQDAQKAVLDAKGRITKAELKQLAAGQFNATLHFEVAPEAAGPIRDRLRQLGRVARLEIDRVQTADGQPVPKGAEVKRGDTVFLVQLYNLANVAPRETAVLTVAVPDVPAAYQKVRDAVSAAKGRVVTAQLNEQDRQSVTAQLDFEVKRGDEGPVLAALAGAGEVVARQVTRAPEGDNVTDSKVLYRATVVSAARLRPREVTVLAVEVDNVDATATVFGVQVAEAGGRQADAQVARERSGQVTARLVYEVPLSAAAGLVERFKSAGTVRVHQSARDPQAPDGKFATARLEVTLSNAERIVGDDEGVAAQARRGLAYSAEVLLASVTWVVFGLCVVLPWAVVGYLGYRVARWLFRKPTSPAAAQTVAP